MQTPAVQTPVTHWVKANGLRFRCLEWPAAPSLPGGGPPADAPVALLLHGLTSCAETWSLVAPALAETFRVLAPDLRGHGDTDKPGHGYDFPTINRDLTELLDGLGVRRAHVVGHSWGSNLAVSLAGHAPERVARLALLDGGFVRPNRREHMSPEQLEQMLAPLEIYASQESYMTEVRRNFPGVWTPALETIALSSIYDNPDGSVREKLDRENQKHILQNMFTSPPEPRLAAVACPMILLPAETNHPDAAERMAMKRAGLQRTLELVPHAAVQWVPDSPHDVQLHRPDMVAATLHAFFTAAG